MERPPSVADAGGRDRGGSGWRPALRIARRELLRAKARTLLVLFMVLLPVTAVVAGDTLARTADISVIERLPGDLGDAQARIDPGELAGPVQQSPDLTWSGQVRTSSSPRVTTLTESALLAALPPGARLLPVRSTRSDRGFIAADGRVLRAVSVGVDLSDPALRGPYLVAVGRAPTSATEVGVSADLAQRGASVGSTLRLADGSPRTVTAVVRSASDGDDDERSTVFGVPAAVGLTAARPNLYYVGGPEVTWDRVLAVNTLGATVLSRSVVLDPPPDDEVPNFDDYSSDDTTFYAVIALVVVMAVLEVVLLAGPAFAVGARRQRRTLALMAAGGGEPRHVRRVVLAQGLLIGLTAAVIGAPLGIAIAAIARAPLRRYGDAEFGPFEVNVRDVALVVLLGGGTALLAALWPALLAGRQSVVGGLRGRRLVTARAGWPGLLGVVLLALGLLGTYTALRRGGPFNDGLGVAAAAVPTVLGAALLAPLVLAGFGRLAGRLPLPLRFAIRDADRQRGRTAPAVAAVTATVAAVVALGVANNSDASRQGGGDYRQGPVGTAVVTGYSDADGNWPALARTARSALPGEAVQVLTALPSGSRGPAFGTTFERTQVCNPDEADRGYCSYGINTAGPLGEQVLVGPAALETLAPLLEPASLTAARRTLSTGGIAVPVWTEPPPPPGFGSATSRTPATLEVRRERVTVTANGQESVSVLTRVTAPVAELRFTGTYANVVGVVSEQIARQIGGARPVALVVGDALTAEQEQRLGDAMLLADPDAQVFVARDQEQDATARTLILVLFLVGAALVLGGTLAATSLALTEARPDLATLGSLGARPRAQRAVAASYALVLAGVGAGLGVLAGLVPGVASAVTLTRNSSGYGWSYSSAGPQEFEPFRGAVIDVPWLAILALVVLVPLVAAAVTAFTAGRRRPAARRLAG